MTKEQYLSLLENKGKYAILYNLLDALGCDPVVCRLRPETIDMIMADLGANRVRVGSFDDAEFDSAIKDYVSKCEQAYKFDPTDELCEETLLFSDDDYLVL